MEKEVRSDFGNGTLVKRWTALNPVTPVVAFEYGVSDHLGSDSVTYTGEGQEQSQRGHLKEGETQKTERQSYDAWGARRNADTWAPAKGPLGESSPAEEREGSNLARGYTGHEMLDDVGLVHMNGRLYDPSLGRMCGADPYVQTPENLQNYNRYSYVLNNPLSQIDPSGHFIIGLIAALVTAIVGIIGGIIATVVAFVAYLAALAAQFVLTVVGLNGAAAAMGSMGASCLAAAKAGVALVSSYVTGAAFGLKGTLLGKMIGGAALSSIYNGAQTAINGGSFSDVLKSAAIGAATGAIGAAVGGLLHGIPDGVSGALMKQGISEGVSKVAAAAIHSAAHGVAGGLMTTAMGGTFQDGFIGSAIGAGVSHITGFAFGEVTDDIGIVGRTALAALSGGAASVLAGGKFADGAFSAAFFHLFNQEMGAREVEFAKPDRDLSTTIDPHASIVLYDGSDLGWSDPIMGEGTTGRGFKHFAALITGGYENQMIDISQGDWQSKYDSSVARLGGNLRRVIIADHGSAGRQEFGNKILSPSGGEWQHITRNLNPARVSILLGGCNVANGAIGSSYLMDLSRYTSKFPISSANRYVSRLQVTGYKSFVHLGRNRGAAGGSFVSKSY